MDLKIIIKEISLFLKVITSPTCWFRNYRYNKHWDKIIRKDLENPIFEKISNNTCVLNGTCLWISNFPYNSCNPHGKEWVGMPSRKTVFLFDEIFMKNTKNIKNNE